MENGDNHITPREPEDEPLSGMTGRSLLVMSIVSAVVYFLIALGIFYFFREDGIAAAFQHGFTFPRQLVIGGASGVFAAIAIMYVAGRPPVSGVLDDFALIRAIARARFTDFDRAQVSLFAGAGEELLFRGAVQPLLGIWLTSVIFVGIHGYFKFRKPGHWLFGFMMFALSMLLGVLYEYIGLIAAMTAHAVYDVIMLWWVEKNFEF